MSVKETYEQRGDYMDYQEIYEKVAKQYVNQDGPLTSEENQINAWVMLEDHSYRGVRGATFSQVAAQLLDLYRHSGDQIKGWGRLTYGEFVIADHGMLSQADIHAVCTPAYAAVSLTHQLAKQQDVIEELRERRERMVKARNDALMLIGDK